MAIRKNRLFAKLASNINAQGDVTADGLAASASFDSADTVGLVDSAYIQARVTLEDAGLDSAQVLSAVALDNFTKYDSANTLGLIDSAYINSKVVIPEAGIDSAQVLATVADANFTKYDSFNTAGILDAGGYLTAETTTSLSINANTLTYTDEAGNDTDIDLSLYLDDTNLARLVSGTLDNQTNIATFTRDDATTFTVDFSSLLNTYDSSNTLGLIDSAYINARVVIPEAFDSSNVIGIVDSAYISNRVTIPEAGVDSATVIQIISDANFTKYDSFNTAGILDQQGFATEAYVTSTIDSAYINNRVTIPEAGVDSNAIIGIVDSAYVAARQAGGISGMSQYNFVADSGQTVFTGMSLNPQSVQVFLNGILLKLDEDYTVTADTVTFTDGVDSGGEVNVIAIANYSQRVSVDDYVYTASSGQTVFSGADDNSETLSYTSGNLQVHFNGILLTAGQDYTATDGSVVSLTSAADSGDVVVVTAISGDSAYSSKFVGTAVTQVLDQISTIDSENVIGIIDSAYINNRVTIPEAFDSNNVVGIIDSDYVQSKQNNFNFSQGVGLTNIDGNLVPTLDSTYSLGAPDLKFKDLYLSGNTLSLGGLLIKAKGDTLAIENESGETAGLEAVGYSDSDVSLLVDSAYVQSRQSPESLTSLSINANTLTYTDEQGNDTDVDLSLYLDDTNLARLVSGTLDNQTKIATFTRDDATTFTVDFSSLLNTYDSANTVGIIESYGYSTYDSANTVGLVDSAYINSKVTIPEGGLDSAAAVNLISANSNTFQATASGTLANGQIVIVNSDGTVSFGQNIPAQSESVGSFTVFSSLSTTEAASVYDPSSGKIVVFYKGADVEAVVGTVSGTTISFGSPTVVDTITNTANYRIVYDSVNQKVVVAYSDRTGDDIKAAVGTVSGDSISFGTPASSGKFFNKEAEVRSMTYHSANPASPYSVNGAIVITAFTFQNISGNFYRRGEVVVANVSGNSIDWGSGGSNIFTYDWPNSIQSAYDPNSNKVLIVWSDNDDGDKLKGVVGQMSTSNNYLLDGSIQLIDGSPGEPYALVYDTSAQKFIVVFRENSTITAALLTIDSSDNIIKGGTATVESSVNHVNAAYSSSLDKTVVTYVDYPNNDYGYLKLGTVDGNSISFSDAAVFGATSVDQYTAIAVDENNNKIAISFRDNNNSFYGTSVVFQPATDGGLQNLTANNFIGFSDGSYTDGQTATVQIAGAVNSGQSGLTPGLKYYVQNDGSIASTEGDPVIVAGTAVASDKIIVKG